jgi:glutathione S-transferase
MYKIYWRAGSASFAVEVLLEELGVSYERVRIKRISKSKTQDWFQSLNPLGQVPVLGLPDGSVMSESAAIMIWLADKHTHAGLAPGLDTPERSAYLRWMVYMATNVYITFRRIYRGDLYTRVEDHQVSIREMAEQDLLRDLAIVERELDPGPYLLGERFSAADIYLAMFPDWHTDREALLSGLPRINHLCDIIQARPAVSRIRAFHVSS